LDTDGLFLLWSKDFQGFPFVVQSSLAMRIKMRRKGGREGSGGEGRGKGRQEGFLLVVQDFLF